MINLGIAIAITAMLYLLTFKLLNMFTLHGKAITLPNFVGLTVDELDNFAINREFDFFVIDSIYDESKDRGSIVMQDPLAGSQVKSGRKIYLTIVAMMPERVRMPDLRDYSIRQAVSLLETYGLKTGRLRFVKSDFENAVLEQLFRGDTIPPDSLIIKGSTIDLIVGKGQSKIPVPFLIGLSRDEAVKKLNMSSLNAGRFYYLEEEDPVHSRVYDQKPAVNSESWLEMGTVVDIWLRSDEFYDFDALIESLQPDTTAIDTSGANKYDVEPLELE